MDFEFHFTKEQEDFRKEVRAFIKANAYKDPIVPVDWEFMTPEMFLHGRELQKKLGAKGWFAPAYPKEYGGGGLDVEHCVIIAQEFADARKAGIWPLNHEVSSIQTGGIMAQGTEEQKRRFLPKLLSGEWEGWQAFTEPDAGSDEAAMSSSAVRDGDYYIITGDKIFIGENPEPLHPNYLYWPAVTNPKAPRHENISAFFIPADLPGIKYEAMKLTCSATGQKWEVWCENVRCPANCLIGQENKGWLVTQATLALEHGGGGAVIPRSDLILRLIEYCKTTKRNGKPISSDPLIQDALVKLYIEYQTGRLWGLRNFQMSEGKIPRVPYTGTQTSLHGKRLLPFLGKALLDILGPHALLNDPELALMRADIEYAIRMADVTHPGGTPEVQQIIMARGLGLGRGSRPGAAPKAH
jgi:alkylation response protein AidB-like acyl-CoA dehydrogenase